MNQTELKQLFGEEILSRMSAGFVTSKADDDHYTLQTEYAEGNISFYDIGITEMQVINTKTNEVVFYLHFELTEMNHAIELLDEMISCMKLQKFAKKYGILLCCSCGITTSYFAEKLNMAAEAMDLDYWFSAVPIDRLYQEAQKYDVILVSPQISFRYDETRSILSTKIVLKVPAQAYAAYSAHEVIDEVRSALENQIIIKQKETPDQLILDTNYRILAIEAIGSANGMRYACRYYKGGRPLQERVVIKERMDTHDFEDIISTFLLEHPKMQCVSIALPGIVNDGCFSLPVKGYENYDLKKHLMDKYGLTVVIENDVNAAALGFAAVNQIQGTLLFHFQPLGDPTPGEGIVIQNQLHQGRMSVAGELKYLLPLLNIPKDIVKKIWLPEENLKLVTAYLLASITVLAPDVIVVSSDLLKDPDVVKEQLKNWLPEEYIPAIHIAEDLQGYMALGSLAAGVAEMKKMA